MRFHVLINNATSNGKYVAVIINSPDGVSLQNIVSQPLAITYTLLERERERESD